MMSLEQSEYCGLDNIGSRIWALLDQPMTVAVPAAGGVVCCGTQDLPKGHPGLSSQIVCC